MGHRRAREVRQHDSRLLQGSCRRVRRLRRDESRDVFCRRKVEE